MLLSPNWRTLTCSIVQATVLACSFVTPAIAQLEDGCPRHFYMGNNPNGTDAPDWSEQAQGIANDGYHWFFTHNELDDEDLDDPPRSSIIKYFRNWYPVNGDDPGKILSRRTPSILYEAGLWHWGDPDHYGGYVFVPFEGSGPMRAVIAVLRASDLAMVDWIDITPYQPKTGWVAIDPVEKLLYTSDDSLVAGTPLLAYPFDLALLDDGIQGNFLAFPPVETGVLDADGGLVDGEFTYMQGGVFSPLGDLYLIVGKAGDSPSSVRGGIHLFRRTPAGEFRLETSSVNIGVPAGTEVFAYQYDPGFTGLGEEPEGIDWWNQDNVAGSRYAGQLHAILLDNQIGDDQIWLKHYQVAYDCARGIDSDGDGVDDWDEIYLFNTHPLLTDSDQDGLDDAVDNCPFVSNAAQGDLDGDGAGDVCDADADGDGQSNEDEGACGSDPFDAAQVSADLDGDAIPDCVDDDDDGDGQTDEDELACGSDPLDGDSTSPDFDADGQLDCLDPDDDNDGVADDDDRCAETLIPDPVIPASGTLKTNRYSLLDGDLVFDRNVAGNPDLSPVTVADTGGCNAVQIADAMGLSHAHYESGLSRSVLQAWIELVQP